MSGVSCVGISCIRRLFCMYCTGPEEIFRRLLPRERDGKTAAWLRKGDREDTGGQAYGYLQGCSDLSAYEGMCAGYVRTVVIMERLCITFNRQQTLLQRQVTRD
ncbi:hypothetical protein AG1IA_08694 [Rhizoctonia solani AG-1 IA]|uniref:Uncharacterized protein n=1 Tax=Thanatephorus cucumeris (strain AG1-IA) TaxID=983506 RepID=L8WGI9_THACA|nr:hypothetical protein AG1IA_08694 [Rhizoctonia solani AG-1 IA]